MTALDLGMSGSAGCLDQFIPKLTHSIQNLVEVFVHSFYGPPEGLVNHSIPLVVPKNIRYQQNIRCPREPPAAAPKSPPVRRAQPS
jgi:hypothetical protein